MGQQAQETEALHQEVRGRLSAAEQLYTTGRRRVIELLAMAGRPVTIPELIGGHPDIALSSAYRNMVVLEEVGVVSRLISGGEHARFELAEGIDGHHHHHLICESCGRVDDFTVPDAVERTIEAALDEIAKVHAFVATSHRLDIVGECSDCATA